ncbi:MAG: hypothetical protein WBR24_00075 [Desulfobacterales bacterium]
MLKLTCVSMIRTGSSAGKKKRKFKVDEGRPACKPPFKTDCTGEKKRSIQTQYKKWSA